MNSLEARIAAQNILGVKADGDLGKRSWTAYRKAGGGSIATLQRLLGFTGAAIDGVRGPATDALLSQLDDSPDALDWPPSARQIAQVSVAPTLGNGPLHGPLGREEREKTFGGPFKWRRQPEAGNPENIVILGDWEEENIVSVEIPQLRQVPGNFSRMRWNKRGVEQLRSLWAAWEKAGLIPLVKSYEGSYVPRLIRGSTTSLSNHAYGSAFDINYFWNQLGKTPARCGAVGSVQELVPLAHEHGFYWGGNFTRLDGMHFEICKLL
jgi:hypothetical protein